MKPNLRYVAMVVIFLAVTVSPYCRAQIGQPQKPASVRLQIGSDYLRHTGTMSAAYSPDGKYLATGASDVRLWDLKRKRLLRIMTLPNRIADGDVWQMRFSPDGKTILVRGTGVGHVSGFDVATGKRLFRFQPDIGGVGTFDISPDGKILALGGGRSNVVLYDYATKKELRTLLGHKSANKPGDNVFLQSVAFSPDGKWLASRALYDDSVRVFHVQSGKQIYALDCPSLYRAGVVFSPDGYLAAYKPLPENRQPGADNTTSIVLWDLKTGKIHKEYDWVPQWGPGYHDLIFSPDGKWMAGDRKGSRIRVWDRASGEVHFVDPRPVSPVGKLIFSPDGFTLLTADGGDFNMWNLKTGQSLLKRNGHTGMILDMDVSPDGTRIVTGSADLTTRMWDAKTGKQLLHIAGIGGFVRFSPDGKTFLTGSGKYDGGLLLHDSRTGRRIRRFQIPRHESGVQPSGVHAAFSADGKTLAVGTNLNMGYYLFNVADAKLQQTEFWNNGLDVSTSWCPCCFSADGKNFAGIFRTGADFRTALKKMPHGDPKILGKDKSVMHLAFSPDGEYLAWMGRKHTTLWDMREKKILRKYNIGNCLTYSPDGRYLACGKHLHPLNKKDPALTLPVEPGHLKFSRDGKTAVMVPQYRSTVLVIDMAKLPRGE